MTERVVDSHQHFWDLSRLDYPWMSPAVEVLRRNFLPQDLRPLLLAEGVHQTVLVQAHQSKAEARWLLELAKSTDFIAGVVAWVDLTSPALGKDLDELQRHTKFKGIRHMIHDEPDEGWMIRADVVAGFRELERRDIPYDLLVRPQHLKFVPQLREQCPRLRLVIDHIAKPLIAAGKVAGWDRDIERVAALPNVWCKLSGMITEARWEGWTPEDLTPYVAHVVGCFGYDRVMFGSDWPVCNLAGSYQRVTDALRQTLGPLSAEDSAKIWGRSARQFYQLS